MAVSAKRMLEGPWCLRGHLAQQFVVGVVQFEQRDFRDETENFLKQKDERVGEEGKANTTSKPYKHGKVNVANVAFLHNGDAKIAGAVGYEND